MGTEICDVSALKGDEPGIAGRLVRAPEYTGGQLRGFASTDNPDFIDQYGRTYDAIGGPTAWTSPKLAMDRMITQIYRHMYQKTGIDFTVLDLTGASSGQVDDVFKNLDAWGADPSQNPLSKLIILGDGY